MEKFIQSVIERSPNKEAASLALTRFGALHLEARKIEMAELLLKNALEQQEQKLALTYLATLYLQTDRLEEAKAHLHRAADVHQFPAAQLHLAQIYQATKDHETAKKYYAQLLSSKSEFTATALFGLACLCEDEQTVADKLAYLHRAADEFDFPHAHAALGKHYAKTDPAKAKEYLGHAIARRHDSIWQSDPATLNDTHYQLGTVFAQEQNIKVAKKYYRRAAENQHPAACWELARQLEQEGGNKELIKKYLHTLADTYKVSVAQWLLGWKYSDEHNYAQTKLYWHKAADEHQHVPSAIELSYLYRVLNEPENAKRYYELAASHASSPEDMAALEKLRAHVGMETDVKS